MPTLIRFQLIGDRELAAKLRALGDQLPHILEEATLKAADIITKEAQALAPVRRGVLRGDISADTIEKTPTRVAVAIGTERSGFYGKFVELGTRKSPPHPWLRPAADATEDKVVASFVSDIAKALEDHREK